LQRISREGVIVLDLLAKPLYRCFMLVTRLDFTALKCIFVYSFLWLTPTGLRQTLQSVHVAGCLLVHVHLVGDDLRSLVWHAFR